MMRYLKIFFLFENFLVYRVNEIFDTQFQALETN